MAEPMTEVELRQVVMSQLESTEGGEDSRVSNERERNLDYYRGDRYGDEREGHSSVITREVMDVVEWIMPMLMRVFHGTDEVARFTPVGEEDEAIASQRTEYTVNVVYLKDNPGYEVSTDVMKSGLIEKNGYWQISWQEEETSKRTKYSGLTEEQIQVLMGDEPDSRVFEIEREPVEGQEGIFDVEVRRIFTKKWCKVESVPPEEMRVTGRSKSLDEAISSGGLVGRNYTLTRGQLVAMGYDEDEVRALSSLPLAETGTEKQNRYQDQENQADRRIHWSQEEIAVFDAWMKIDFDGDGYPEIRMVRLAGNTPDGQFLENEETDDHPFVDWTPIRQQFDQQGIAVADIIAELQLLKSTLWRQLLDSLYSSVNPEYETVKDQVVDWDSVLTDAPGNHKLVEVQGTITPLVKPFVGANALPVLDKVDEIITGRSGVSSVSSGVDPDLLQQHAEGTVEKIMSAAQERVGLIARNFAEFGFKNVMIKIAQVSAANQDKPRQVKLNGLQVMVDPSKWAPEFDVEVDVGLGTGNDRMKMAQLGAILAKQEMIFEKMGFTNPLVSLKQYWNTLALLTRKSDLPSSAPFFTDPESPEGEEAIAKWQQQQEQQQQAAMQSRQQLLDTENAKTAQKAQSDQAQARMDMIQFIYEQDAERNKTIAELGLKREEIEAKYGVQIQANDLKAFEALLRNRQQGQVVPFTGGQL